MVAHVLIRKHVNKGFWFLKWVVVTVAPAQNFTRGNTKRLYFPLNFRNYAWNLEFAFLKMVFFPGRPGASFLKNGFYYVLFSCVPSLPCHFGRSGARGR